MSTTVVRSSQEILIHQLVAGDIKTTGWQRIYSYTARGLIMRESLFWFFQLCELTHQTKVIPAEYSRQKQGDTNADFALLKKAKGFWHKKQ